MTKNPVLIVEDNRAVLKLYKETFLAFGFKVEEAGDGEEGLIKAREINPSVILLDIMMPKLDGISVLKKLKLEPATKDIPVIMLTSISTGSLGVDEEALEAGAVKYIVKDESRPDEVVRIVNEVLSGSGKKNDQ